MNKYFVLFRQKDQPQIVIYPSVMAYFQQNMLSIKSRTILAHLFAEITLLSQSIETFREALADVPYFDCISLFRFLDKQEKGYLQQKDFQRAIGTSHRKLLTYAFSWFDTIKVGEISRLEFTAFILPKDNLELRELVTRRIQHSEISSMQLDTLNIQFSLFRELVLQIIQRQMKMIELRRELIAETDYSIRGSLLAIDVDGHNWICSDDILRFMKNYGMDVNARQVEKMVEMVNCSMDGKLNEQQLIWIIEGFEGKERGYLNKIKACNKKIQTKKPVYFQRSFSEHKRRNKSELAEIQKKNVHQSQYKSLIKKMKTAEHKQKQIDKRLWQQQAQVVKVNSKKCEKQIMELKFKRKIAELEEIRKRQQIAIQSMLKQQFEELMSKASRIQSQTDRLLQQENRMVALDDYGLKENRTFYIPKGHTSKLRRSRFQSNLIDVDLMNHSSLLRYRKPCLEISNCQNLFGIDNFASTKRNDSIKKHIQDSEIYLSRSKAMRDRIRQERESQRQIYQSFISKQKDQLKRTEQRLT